MVVVGAGQAGLQAAEALRSGGWTGPVLLLGDEPLGPYHRPPLSKAFLAGRMESAQLIMRAADALARRQIELRTGVRVSAIDRIARALTLSDGSRLPYEGLVLATGARARLPSFDTADVRGFFILRALADATALAGALGECARDGRPLVIIGGGFIGLEVAATARSAGVEVSVLESAPRLLARVLTPALSEWFANLHRGHGVSVLTGVQVSGLEADASGAVVAVQLADGRRLPAGAVVAGIGAVPNDDLAREAGLACDRGIVVDECGRTDDPHITAAGDCTARRLQDGSLLRLESVNNATEQGRAAALALLGQERPFRSTPWFWSDQYDRKLQMAGLSAGAEEHVLRGSLEDGSFSVFHFRAGRLVAVDSVSAPKEHLLARRLLDAGVTPMPAQCADPGFDLASLLPAAAAGGSA
jgi:3-phenylpropionate/trans-cinnamate dioxygenase ferredoxin reductase subunit